MADGSQDIALNDRESILTGDDRRLLETGVPGLRRLEVHHRVGLSCLCRGCFVRVVGFHAGCIHVEGQQHVPVLFQALAGGPAFRAVLL